MKQLLERRRNQVIKKRCPLPIPQTFAQQPGKHAWVSALCSLLGVYFHGDAVCTEGAQKLLYVCNGGDGPWGMVPSTGWSHCWYISCLNPDTGRIQLCRKCLGPFDGTGEWSRAFRRCALAEDLYHQVRDLDEEVSRLCSICGNGKKTDCIF